MEDLKQILFAESEAAQTISTSKEFEQLYDQLMVGIEEAEEDGQEAEDLEPEDDEGNIEYKLTMSGISMYKVVKRTT